jgi:hypothetical protein
MATASSPSQAEPSVAEQLLTIGEFAEVARIVVEL